MLNKLRSYVTLISMILAIIGSSFGAWNMHLKNKETKARINAETELFVKTTQVMTYENELGQQVTKTLEYQVHIADLRYSNDSLERQVYRTLQASKMRDKELKEAIAVNMKSSISGGYDTTYYQDVVIEEADEMDSTIVEKIATIQVKEFHTKHYDIIVYEDSIHASYDADFVIIKAARKVDRDFFMWRWIGWQKTTNGDYIELTSDDPNAKYNGRLLKIN